MKTALYVFLAILAAYAVIYIFERVVAFVKRVNRNAVKATPSFSTFQLKYGGIYGLDPYRTGIILDKLDKLLERVDRIEDAINNDPKND